VAPTSGFLRREQLGPRPRGDEETGKQADRPKKRRKKEGLTGEALSTLSWGCTASVTKGGSRTLGQGMRRGNIWVRAGPPKACEFWEKRILFLESTARKSARDGGGQRGAH